MKTRITILIAALFAAFLSTTYAGAPGRGYGGGWPAGFTTPVTTSAKAMDCCKQGATVALVCKDCKTINAKSGDKKGIAAWFKADSTHGCSGCGGKITVHQGMSGKSGTGAEYTHTCSKCGAKAAYVCATHS